MPVDKNWLRCMERLPGKQDNVARDRTNQLRWNRNSDEDSRLHRSPERFVQERHLGIEDVLDAQQDWHLQATLLHASDDFGQLFSVTKFDADTAISR